MNRLPVTPLVIKVGGAFMQADRAALSLLKVIKTIQHTRPIVLVHGGGPMVEELLSALQLTSTKIDGLRVTPAEHMPFIVGALAGTANKQLCALAIQADACPVGLSLADGDLVRSSQISQQLGAVGKASKGEPELLIRLLDQNGDKQFLPIVSSIGVDQQGNLLNVNADQAATVIAQLLNAELFLLSDVPGVLDANKQLLVSLNNEQISQLVQEQVIRDGMQVKVAAAMDAAIELGRPVTIASWKAADALLGLLDKQSVGTKIIP